MFWLHFIEGFINDRMRSAPYYSNAEYITAQFERIRLFGEISKAESVRMRLEKEGDSLKDNEISCALLDLKISDLRLELNLQEEIVSVLEIRYVKYL